MGTTRTMLEGGSSQYVYIAAIEGYEYLLTSGSSAAAAVTAWSGTDWTQALTGLSVDLKLSQSLDPNEPFGEMGTCMLWVQKTDAADTFGVATHRRGGGVETYLSASLDRDDTTASVSSAALFPSSGNVYIGTECIGYSGKGGSSFTGLTRGKFSPFPRAGGARFARDHTVRNDSNTVNLQPLVTSLPRTWRGRFVGVWMHRVVGGVLDVKEQAELVFAGTVNDIRDDRETGCTVVEVRSVMDWLNQRVIGEGMFEGKVEDGVYLQEGLAFSWHETGYTGTTYIDNSVGTVLEVGAPLSAVTTYSFPEGIYTGSQIASYMNAWLAAEHTLGNLGGSYSISTPVSTIDGLRTRISYALALDNGGRFRAELPAKVANVFGWSQVDDIATAGHVKLDVTNMGVGLTYQDPDTEPLRVRAQLNGQSSAKILLESTSGELIDQYSLLPSSIRPATDVLDGVTYSWGLFIVGDSVPLLGAFDSTDPTYLIGLKPWLGGARTRVGTTIRTTFPVLEISASDPPPRVRQIYAVELEFATLVVTLFLSTGTVGYNSILDLLPRQLGIGMPESLVGADFLAEVPGASETCVVVIEKATRLSDILRADMFIRWGFAAWQDSTIRFRSWRSPAAADAVLELDDTSKAEPSGVIAPQVAASTQTDQWMKSVVKIEFDRSFVDLGEDKYKSSIMFYDSVAVEDQGGATKVHTVGLPNTFEEFTGTGSPIESLAPQFLAKMPMVSRPQWIVERSISPALFWQLCVGDVVTFTDPHARDPQTGERGISERPALITHLSFQPGGTIPTGSGPPTQLPMGARVRLFFTETDPERSTALYAPSANVDSTVSSGGFSGGYNSGTSTLRFEAHAYSNAAEDADATHFDANDVVDIFERDAEDPTAPISWQRTIQSQSGNDITFTSGLSSPAWDPTKKYVVTFANYGDSVATQKTHVFQADDTSGLIESATIPYLYGSGSADTADANDSAAPELPADRIYADGAGRCVYGDTQAIRLVDNFIDYNSQQRDSYIFQGVQNNEDFATGSGYKLVGFWPVFLSHELLSSSVWRYITSAPMACSIDGTSTKVRVRLRSTRPTETTLYNPTPVGDFATAEWTGITSTTMTTLTPQTTLTVNVKNGVFSSLFGVAYVTLEIGYKCSTFGLAHWSVGARQTL